ncbi:MAG: AarF/UbiB family protein [Thaumarchaeota archaeon]|jgi:RIO kinase 2|nr:AarF/UbiB family protein [Candidatus Terraquivivens yellowstonensis]MCL7392059.1 AarF/UbiB family protein [Candidatus Terraquivivens yellowstonensis]MCL7400021.1 AarF/UbiB family protein [Candidatus Terraquivivens yellowstonensis]
MSLPLHELVRRFGELTEEDYCVLSIMERNLGKFREVPYQVILQSIKFSETKLERSLEKLHRLRLIWSPKGKKIAYVLNYLGLDALALRTLSSKGIISGLGMPIGMGKEADVYDAISREGRRLAVKFFRIGRPSFKKYERVRESLVRVHNYLEASIKAAQMEFKALLLLVGKVPVPAPVYRTRHVVVTELFEGIELASLTELENAEKVLLKIIDAIKSAYEAGVVHRDLSAYNVLIKPDGSIMLIDWPQWVKRSHPQASLYLERDVKNILSFFARKWDVRNIPPEYEKIIEEITGKSINIYYE